MTDPARDQVIERHHYLCVRGARKFLRDGIDRSDLEQVAAIGLIKAADRFDPRVGTPFEAYAWRFVVGELMHYVRDTERLLRVPRRVRDLHRRAQAAEALFAGDHGRSPTLSELADLLRISATEASEIKRFREDRVLLSTEDLHPREAGRCTYTLDAHLDRLALESGFAALTPVEASIIREIYQYDTPVSEVAKRLGYSRRHVTRLRRSALDKLAPLGRPLSA